MASLKSVRSKIDRANLHFRDLKAFADKILPANDGYTGPPYEYDADRQHLSIFAPVAAPIDQSFSLVLGDCIHNLRSALDHLVFQLAVLNGKGGDAQTKTHFPIFLTPDEFKKRTKKHVEPFISAAAFTAIEALQPYKTGDMDKDILWIISQLDIIDKHRLLVVVAQHAKPINLRVTVPTGETFESPIEGEWKRVESKAELLRVDLSRAIRTPGNVQVNLDSAKSIQIVDSGLDCDGRDLGRVISDCMTVVSTVVNDFGKDYFGE